jgi:hypothetical protein
VEFAFPLAQCPLISLVETAGCSVISQVSTGLEGGFSFPVMLNTDHMVIDHMVVVSFLAQPYHNHIDMTTTI